MIIIIMTIYFHWYLLRYWLNLKDSFGQMGLFWASSGINSNGSVVWRLIPPAGLGRCGSTRCTRDLWSLVFGLRCDSHTGLRVYGHLKSAKQLNTVAVDVQDWVNMYCIFETQWKQDWSCWNMEKNGSIIIMPAVLVKPAGQTSIPPEDAQKS